MSAPTVLMGGLVADGSGAEPVEADVVVGDGVIEAVVPRTQRPFDGYEADVLDVGGRIVAPGFVDLHCHSDLSLLAYPGNESRVSQGITTEVVGNCGMSPAPGNENSAGLAEVISTIDVVPDLRWNWADLPGWLNVLDRTPTSTNVAALVGHGSARFAVSGMRPGPLSPPEIEELSRTLAEALDSGCLGVSLGLMYSPGEHADAAELATVAEVVSARDSLLAAHLRDYRTERLVTSVNEVTGVASSQGARLQLSHLRGIGGGGNYAEVLGHVAQLREQADVAADLYPYTAGHTTLIQLLPPNVRSAGPVAVAQMCREDRPAVARMLAVCGHAPEQITIMKALSTPEAVGCHAGDSPTEPWDWLARILELNHALVDVAVVSGRWEDIDLGLSTPWISIASDGTALDHGHQVSVPHPRSWGAFPAAYRRMRFLGIEIGEVIRRLSTAPAQRAGFDAGITGGARADLVVFDDDRLDSTATYASPSGRAIGIDHVFVRGTAVLADGEPTAARPGRLMRRRGQTA